MSTIYEMLNLDLAICSIPNSKKLQDLFSTLEAHSKETYTWLRWTLKINVDGFYWMFKTPPKSFLDIKSQLRYLFPKVNFHGATDVFYQVNYAFSYHLWILLNFISSIFPVTLQFSRPSSPCYQIYLATVVWQNRVLRSV